MILTRQQIKSMEAQGLSKQRIEELAKERGLKMPSASIGGLLGKAARFTGVEKLGQGLGYALFQLTPEYKGLVKDLESGRMSPDDFERATTGGITTGEVLGSAVQTAGTIASFGQLGKLAQARTAGAALGNVRKGAVIGAGVGGVIGGGKGAIEAAQKGEGITGIGSRTFSGALGGGLVGAGVGAVGGAMSGGAFLQGAKVGAIEGAKSGAVFGGTRAMGEGLAEDEDISGLTAKTLGGTLGGGLKGAIFGSLVGGTISAGTKAVELKKLRKLELTNALKETSESILPEKATIVSRKTSPYNIEQTKKGLIAAKDKLFKSAVRDTSLSPDDIAIVKASQKGDYNAYKEMINIAKSDDVMAVDKPISTAGKTLIKRLQDIGSAKSKAAREIGEIAQTRLDKDIPQLQQSINQLNDDLASYGISVKGDKVDFKGSDFEDLPGVQRFIETIYRRAGEINNNGLKAHQLKRFIDEQIAYGKQTEGLTGTAERVIKAFRRNIDGVLDSADKGYNVANTRYGIAINAQTGTQRIMGKDFNIADELATMRAGEVMNRILGNASARPLQVLNDIEKATRDLGYKYSDNVVAQVKFADMLESIVGAPTRSLGGQSERAINRAMGLKDFVKDANPLTNNLGEFLKTSLSRTPEERLGALLDYINKLSK